MNCLVVDPKLNEDYKEEESKFLMVVNICLNSVETAKY